MCVCVLCVSGRACEIESKGHNKGAFLSVFEGGGGRLLHAWHRYEDFSRDNHEMLSVLSPGCITDVSTFMP